MGGTLHPPPQPCLQVITPSANGFLHSLMNQQNPRAVPWALARTPFQGLPWASGFRPSGAPSVTLRRGGAVFPGTSCGGQSMGASLGRHRWFHAPLSQRVVSFQNLLTTLAYTRIKSRLHNSAESTTLLPGCFLLLFGALAPVQHSKSPPRYNFSRAISFVSIILTLNEE